MDRAISLCPGSCITGALRQARSYSGGSHKKATALGVKEGSISDSDELISSVESAKVGGKTMS